MVEFQEIINILTGSTKDQVKHGYLYDNVVYFDLPDLRTAMLLLPDEYFWQCYSSVS